MLMKKCARCGVFVFAMLWSTVPSFAQTVITYQGQLQEAGAPFTGLVNLEFVLFDGLVGGSQLAGPVLKDAVPVEDGLFQVELDFGPGAFGAEGFLEISVDGTVLAPRQRVTAAPRSLRAEFAADGSWPFRLEGGNAVFTSGNVGIGTNSPDRSLVVVGSGLFGRSGNSASSFNAFVTGGAGSSFNAATGQQSFVGGGFSNQAQSTNSFVAGGAGNLVSGINSLAGGGASNIASGNNSVALGVGAVAAANNSFAWSDGSGAVETSAAGQFLIGASGGVGVNIVPDAALHVAGSGIFGSADNSAPGTNAFVTGAESLLAGNHATGAASAVLGGTGNVAQGGRSVVLGGTGNLASGEDAVAAGSIVTASGRNSFALGRDATASHLRTFVWSGSGFGNPFESTAPYQYLIRADAGVGINTNAPEASLHVVGSSPTADPFGQLRLEGRETSGAADTGAGVSFVGHDGNIRRIWGWIESVKENDTVGDARARMSFYVRGGTGLPQEVVRFDSFGAAYNPYGTWFTLSDRRSKETVEPIDGALQMLLALEGVRFSYRESSAPLGDTTPRMGFIAQQVERVLPGWIRQVGDGMKHLAPIGFEALAVEAVRELQSDMTAENQRLRAMNRQLADRVSALEVQAERTAALIERQGRLEVRLHALERAMEPGRSVSRDAP